MDATQTKILTATILEILATRHPVPLSVKMIARRAAMEVDFKITEESVSEQLAALGEIKLVASVPDETATEIFWKATDAGVLAWKRGQMRRG